MSSPNTDEVPRVGVFLCDCGINIGGVVRVPEVLKYAKGLPNVAYVEENMYTCSAEGIGKIRKAIKEHNLNRVVVASCTPRTHEPLFRAACQDAGLNPYLFEFANIREHCSWVHMREPEKATEKAKRIVRMSIAKSALLEPQKDIEVEVDPSALVIGAGVSGMTAALSLANQGFKVYLVEKRSMVGGMLKEIYRLYPTHMLARDALDSISRKVMNHEGVTVLTSNSVKDVSGYIGNFSVTVEREGKDVKLKAGTVILATGAEELKPVDMFGYGKYDRVLTQLGLEHILSEKSSTLESLRPRSVVMIQCVGSRQEKGRPYCSRICCMVAIKNSLIIKDLHPRTDVYILYQNLQAYGKDYEELHRKAREKGVKLLNYRSNKPPEVVANKDGSLKVKVTHALLGTEMEIDAGFVVLSTPLIQHDDGKTLSKMLKVPLGHDQFFLEAHVKLRPVDFATDGIYVCGTAHGPKDVGESVAQAYAVASRAGIPMSNRRARADAITAFVDPDLCYGCRLCERLCPYGAPRIQDGKATIVEILCKGCGVCGAACPARAITMKHFTDEQISAAIRAAFDESAPTIEIEPKILGFLCNWCSYAGADTAGVSRIQYPPNIQVVRNMCSGRVDPVHILEAFRAGADGVLVTGCHIGDCHYQSGNLVARKRIKFMDMVLRKIGIEPHRLRLEWVSAPEGGRFAELVKDSTEKLKGQPFRPSEKLLKRIDAAIETLKGRRLRSMLGTLLPLDVKIDEEKYTASVEKALEEELERHMILNEIRQRGPLSPTELSSALDLTSEAIVQHVTALEKTGAIVASGQKEGRNIYVLKSQT